ncbi:MAG: hypothetical protein K2K52_05955, partial [Paramuribaculum sp.]|nr:hypothetical protein [Paramuribaculum sp.]
DEHDTSRQMVKDVEQGLYACWGRIEIENLRENYHIDIPEDDEYQTLAGYILHNAGEIPSEGDCLRIADKLFTIVKGSATRLEVIRIADAPESED